MGDAESVPEERRDRIAIEQVYLQQVLRRYADVVTRRAFGELDQLMTADCVLELDLGDRTASYVGPTAIGEFIESAIARFSFFEMVVLNSVAEVDLDAGLAASRMYMVELRQMIETGRRTDAYGIYHDDLERGSDGQWRLTSRRYQSFARSATEGDADMEVLDVWFEPLRPGNRS